MSFVDPNFDLAAYIGHGGEGEARPEETGRSLMGYLANHANPQDELDRILGSQTIVLRPGEDFHELEHAAQVGTFHMFRSPTLNPVGFRKLMSGMLGFMDKQPTKVWFHLKPVADRLTRLYDDVGLLDRTPLDRKAWSRFIEWYFVHTRTSVSWEKWVAKCEVVSTTMIERVLGHYWSVTMYANTHDHAISTVVHCGEHLEALWTLMTQPQREFFFNERNPANETPQLAIYQLYVQHCGDVKTEVANAFRNEVLKRIARFTASGEVRSLRNSTKGLLELTREIWNDDVETDEDFTSDESSDDSEF